MYASRLQFRYRLINSLHLLSWCIYRCQYPDYDYMKYLEESKNVQAVNDTKKIDADWGCDSSDWEVDEGQLKCYFIT